MERRIEEIFNVGSNNYQCVKAHNFCQGCFFIKAKCYDYFDELGVCVDFMRSDKTNVIFKRV